MPDWAHLPCVRLLLTALAIWLVARMELKVQRNRPRDFWRLLVALLCLALGGLATNAAGATGEIRTERSRSVYTVADTTPEHPGARSHVVLRVVPAASAVTHQSFRVFPQSIHDAQPVLFVVPGHTPTPL